MINQTYVRSVIRISFHLNFTVSLCFCPSCIVNELSLYIFPPLLFCCQSNSQEYATDWPALAKYWWFVQVSLAAIWHFPLFTMNRLGWGELKLARNVEPCSLPGTSGWEGCSKGKDWGGHPVAQRSCRHPKRSPAIGEEWSFLEF